jgi:protocatechuate 3,4-dioxygenase beta subunit
LVTHVFIDGDKYLESDTVFAVKKSLIRKLEHGIDDESKEKCLLLNFDIVMEKE